MGLKAQDCATLAEWRVYGLRKKQWEIAQAAFGDKARQSWISEIENGHMPKPYNEAYDDIVNAYELRAEPEQFIRMVQNAAKLKALTKPIADTEPLFSVADAAQEVLHSTNVSDRVLRILRETMNRRQA